MKWIKRLLIVFVVLYIIHNPTAAAGTFRALGERAYAIGMNLFDSASDFIEGLAQ